MALATIQIREIPESAYEVLRRRARASGRSLRSYMRERVIELASRPPTDKLLRSLEAELASHRTPGGTRSSILGDLAAERR